jgi:hypothetical protein
VPTSRRVMRIEPRVNRLLEDLIKVMTLERLEEDLFRGESRDIGSPQVFGGQVLGQALMAAAATVEGRIAHSLHAYFLRRGDFNSPIVYEVDRARDGNHFSTRRVIAIQHGAQIFNLSASFQAVEKGLDHQIPMPDVPLPEELTDLDEHLHLVLPKLPEGLRRVLERKRPFEFPKDGAAQEHLVPCGRPAARRRGAASMPPGLRVGFQSARHGRDAAWLSHRPPQARHGQHRPCHVVPSQRAGR